jgi:hypothetical protein
MHVLGLAGSQSPRSAVRCRPPSAIRSVEHNATPTSDRTVIPCSSWPVSPEACCRPRGLLSSCHRSPETVLSPCRILVCLTHALGSTWALYTGPYLRCDRLQDYVCTRRSPGAHPARQARATFHRCRATPPDNAWPAEGTTATALYADPDGRREPCNRREFVVVPRVDVNGYGQQGGCGADNVEGSGDANHISCSGTVPSNIMGCMP